MARWSISERVGSHPTDCNCILPMRCRPARLALVQAHGLLDSPADIRQSMLFNIATRRFTSLLLLCLVPVTRYFSRQCTLQLETFNLASIRWMNNLWQCRVVVNNYVHHLASASLQKQMRVSVQFQRNKVHRDYENAKKNAITSIHFGDWKCINWSTFFYSRLRNCCQILVRDRAS